MKTKHEKFVINIGRQLGSGGKIIGEQLASRLGISFYDKELINLASKESGLCKEVFEKADEAPSHTIMGGFFGARFSLFTDSSIPYANYLSNDVLFKIQSDVIRKLAAEQSCLFVGRCADYILRESPRCVNIFVTASREDRVKHLCNQNPITAEQAEEMIVRSDKRRSEYYNYYTYKVWGAASEYDLCINSSALGIDNTTAFIEAFVKRKLKLK